ncbi:hypothetical protein BaRGS_00009577 [Batillaria attramentaria]|uniref:Receptor for retinol uptake STRA6 n=1 Tax=Batillaria attramentaria TaxID=370345 RepID=A0ABD0LK05_9CAEN
MAAEKCESAIDHNKFYQFSLIPAVLITLSFAMTKRRRNMLLSVMDGRPSIVLPLDSFTRVARISYSCAFAATVNLVYDVVLFRKVAIDYSGPNSLKSFIIIVSVFIYGMVFFPLFACLAVGSVFGYGLGALYVWMMTAIEIFKLTECDTNTEGRTIVIFRGLPMVLCLLYLSLSIPVRFVQAVKRGRFFVWQSHLEVVTLDEIRRSYIGRHVTKLLRKPETDSMEEPGSRFFVVKSINLNTIWRLRYRWREGFRYPTVLLSVSLVGFLTVYMSTLELFGLVSVLDKILRHNKEWVESVEYVGTDDVQFELEWWRTIVHLQEILKFSVITGAVVSFAISVVNIVHSLTRFRKNLQALYKGDHSTIPPAGFYFVFNYFMFFYNIFIGLASCLLRIVKSVLIGTCLLSRLDYCLLPRNFEFLDPGFRAYVGYMHMEHAHTHPVVLVFTKLLLLRINSTCSSAQDDRFVHLAAFSQ